jgi:hypothetical protein
MRAVIAGVFVGVGVVAGAAAAQQRAPDFSGRWVIVDTDAPASIARELVVRQTRPTTTAAGGLLITQPDTIEVARHFQTAVESSKYTVGTVGGSFSGPVRGGSPEQVRSTRVATKWEGDKLVIGTATFVGERSTGERYEMWSLTAEGMLSVTIGETKKAVAEIRPVTVTYRRAQSPEHRSR